MTPGLGTACIDMPFLSPMTRVYCSDSRTPCGPPICTCGAAHRPGIPVRVSLEGPQLKARWREAVQRTYFHKSSSFAS